MSADKIAICGVSGRFPNCENVEEFKTALFNNVDLISDDHTRWPHEAFGIPPSIGLLKDLKSFDAAFFGLNPSLTDFHDVRRRILTEVTYEAILDAGINPQELRGRDIGVFAASSPWTGGQGNDRATGSVMANGISFSFDFKGPSLEVDASCSSSLYALHLAVQAINEGLCEKAVVCVARLYLDPYYSIFFMNKGVLSRKGRCKVFSEDRDGFVSSEAVVAILIEKFETARRVYATIEGIGVNVDGYKDDGLFHPSSVGQVKSLRDTYKRFQINPDDVSFMEAHGTGTLVGDVEECTGLKAFFSRTRKTPLLIGSVKSSVGHTEFASGLVSLVKALITFQEGSIPANLHCSKLAFDLPGISDGFLKVVTSNTPFDGGLFGINSFGIGGANGHVVLRPFVKTKSVAQLSSSSRLMVFSGRTAEGVQVLLEKILENRTNEEFLLLIRNIFKTCIPQHNFRCFVVFDGANENHEVSDTVVHKRPVWFVFSGMGSQWPGMGRDLMKLEAFGNTFRKCCLAMDKVGIDLEEILTRGNDDVSQNIIHSFVAITAMQLCLTDVLYSFGITADNIIGHSMGEVACAYADGSLSVEQAMLLSYARGSAAVASNPKPGLMAVCAISKEDCETLLPSDVSIACINSHKNITISGSAKSVKKFVKKLNNNDIFARIVDTGNIAFHSEHIKDAAPAFSTFVKQLIPEPKLRSEKWLSSTFEERDWDNEVSKYSSPEYFQQNYLGQVLFRQVLKFVPEDAVLIEVAPKTILHAILKDEIAENATVFDLLRPAAEAGTNVDCLLGSIGRLYLTGVQLQSSENRTSFPVGPKTPMISPLIKWNREYQWSSPSFSCANIFCDDVTIDPSSSTYSYLFGHVVCGKHIFPGAGYVEIIWKSFAKLSGKAFDKLPVVLERIKFERIVFVDHNEKIAFKVFILKSSGAFEIFERDSLVASGKISIPNDIDAAFIKAPYPVPAKSSCRKLNADDVYAKKLRLLGYDYSGPFRGIEEAENDFQQMILAWVGNWTTFFDSMLQGFILKDDVEEFVLPVQIEFMVIDPQRHLNYAVNNEFDLKFNACMKSARAGFVEIRECYTVKRNLFEKRNDPRLLKSVFIPYKCYQNYGLDDLYFCFIVCLQIIKDSIGEHINYTCSELFDDEESDSHFQNMFEKACSELFFRNTISFETISMQRTAKFSVLLMTKNLFRQRNFMEIFEYAAYIFTETDEMAIGEPYLNSLNIAIVFQYVTDKKQYFLLKKLKPISLKDSSTVEMRNNDFSWVDDLKTAIHAKNSDARRIFLTASENDVGIVGFHKCICKEFDEVQFRVFMCENSAKFSADSADYQVQINKDLAVNIYRNQTWGSYKYLPLEDLQKKPLSHASLKTVVPQDLSSLQWVESAGKYSEASEYLVKICYSSLNFRDVLMASGKLSAPAEFSEGGIGYEFSGIDRNGRRVMGISSGSFNTYVRPSQGLLWEVPPKWTLAQAATVPIAYLTAYYGMVTCGRLQEGESVLVHAGAGGVGLAAITLALKMNCRVFTTVGSETKKQYLLQKFPGLDERNIGNSRNSRFEELIMHETNGEGVDLVLNSLADELFQASVRCLRSCGRFVEIGRHDVINDHQMQTGKLGNNCFLIVIDLLRRSIHQSLGKIFIEAMEKNLFEPLDYKIYKREEAADAFKYLYGSKHVGKLLLKISSADDEASFKFSQDSDKILASPRTHFDPKMSYIIVGGLGGLGLQLAKWLVERGAKFVIINSRRPPSTGYQELILRQFKRDGVFTEISTDDCSTEEGAGNLINSANKLAPVAGIFNAALVLSDAFFDHQTKETFDTVNKPKYKATKCLDKISREQCPHLKHFVVFTSIINGFGTAGLSNYAFTNSSIEELCYGRRSKNLPALAIQFGPISDVGYLQNLKDKKQNTVADFDLLTGQSVASCLKVIDSCLQNEFATVVSSFIYNAKAVGTDKVSLVETLSRIFGIKLDTIKDKSTQLVHLGMDSLTAFDIKTLLSKDYDVELNVKDVEKLSIDDITKLSTK